MAKSSPPTVSLGPSSTSVVLSFISNVPALTTTFTPPPECTNSLTIVGPERSWEAWYNEIVPGPGLTFSACYPKEVVNSYLMSLKGTVSAGFNPIRCPQDYSTVSTRVADKSFTHVVCCPTSFFFHSADTPIAQRPLFGGRCYSDISATSILTYDGKETSIIFFSTTGQAYALAIDGFSVAGTTKPTLGTASGVELPTTPTLSTNAEGTKGSSQHSSGLSEAAKIRVGVGVGVGVGCCILIVGIILYWRHNKGKKNKELRDGVDNPIHYAPTNFTE